MLDTLRDPTVLAVLSELCGISFQAKWTGVTALVRAFHRAVALFAGPRVWPTDPFGAGSCTSGFMLTLEAHSCPDREGAATLCAAIASPATAVRRIHVPSALELHKVVSA